MSNLAVRMLARSDELGIWSNLWMACCQKRSMLLQLSTWGMKPDCHWGQRKMPSRRRMQVIAYDAMTDGVVDSMV